MARARAPYRLLRLLLLLLGLAMVAVVGVMLAAHRFAASSQPSALTGSQAPVTDLDAEDLFRGQGFEFRHEIEGTPIFAIRAEGIRQDRSETSHLAKVGLELYREDGEVVRVRSNEADYNQGSKDAKLVGDVFLDGRGIELETRTLLVSREGQELASPTPVVVRYPPNLAGRASSLRVSLDREHYIMDGGVHLHSTKAAPFPFKLDAERLIHERDQHVIRAIGKVHLERELDVIEAESLIVTFDDTMRQVRSVRARHGVVAAVVADGGLGADRMQLTGDALLVQFDTPSGAARYVELDGDRAVLERHSADAMVQRFVGTRITSELAGGSLKVVDGVGAPVILTESLAMPDQPFMLRQACGQRIVMRFTPRGEPAQLRLEGQVELADRDVYIGGGEQADVDFRSQVMRVSGKRVSLYHDDGQVSAEGFIYRGETRRIQAAGGVSAVLEDRAGRLLRATPLGSGEGPVQVESEKATWTLAPSSFVFEQDVRAWRGENIIFADQLRGDEGEQQIAASGAVKTAWVPRSVAAAGGAPIEVSAKQMVYDRVHGELVYSGSVDAVQDGRRLQCKQLIIELAATSGAAERMRCEGDVILEDPQLGRRVEGELALYALASELIEVTGDPVTVREAGSTLTCRYFRYDVETGAVEIRSAPPAAETPSAETPSAETPSAETSSAETPSAETPSAETPSAETSSAETSSAETLAAPAGKPAAGSRQP